MYLPEAVMHFVREFVIAVHIQDQLHTESSHIFIPSP